MRRYAGFGTAKASNARHRELATNGTGGLSVAFDLQLIIEAFFGVGGQYRRNV